MITENNPFIGDLKVMAAPVGLGRIGGLRFGGF